MRYGPSFVPGARVIAEDSIAIYLDDEGRAEIRKLKDRPVDLSDPDVPEIEEFMVRERGKFYRPIKQQIPLRLDKDIIAWFKARGDKYQPPDQRCVESVHPSPRAGRLNPALRRVLPIQQHHESNAHVCRNVSAETFPGRICGKLPKSLWESCGKHDSRESSAPWCPLGISFQVSKATGWGRSYQARNHRWTRRVRLLTPNTCSQT